MKIIFLDIDGVLITQNDIAEAKRMGWRYQWPSAYRVRQLNRIHEMTQARIVVSSAWRFRSEFPHEFMGATLRSWEIRARLFALTPSEVRESIRVRYPNLRAAEIAEWLAYADTSLPVSVDSFVILDDGSDMGDLSDRLVKCDFETGLTEELADKAIEMLEG